MSDFLFFFFICPLSFSGEIIPWRWSVRPVFLENSTFGGRGRETPLLSTTTTTPTPLARQTCSIPASFLLRVSSHLTASWYISRLDTMGDGVLCAGTDKFPSELPPKRALPSKCRVYSSLSYCKSNFHRQLPRVSTTKVIADQQLICATL